MRTLAVTLLQHPDGTVFSWFVPEDFTQQRLLRGWGLPAVWLGGSEDPWQEATDLLRNFAGIHVQTSARLVDGKPPESWGFGLRGMSSIRVCVVRGTHWIHEPVARKPVTHTHWLVPAVLASGVPYADFWRGLFDAAGVLPLPKHPIREGGSSAYPHPLRYTSLDVLSAPR